MRHHRRGRDTCSVSFGEGELAGDEVDQASFHHQLSTGTHHGATEKELGTDSPPALVEDLGTWIILHQRVELRVHDSDRCGRREVVVEGFLEPAGGLRRSSGQHHQGRRRDRYPA